jgi:hypothetical protein
MSSVRLNYLECRRHKIFIARDTNSKLLLAHLWATEKNITLLKGANGLF